MENREEFKSAGLTLERAVKRHLQAQDIETTVRLTEESIAKIDNEISEARSRKKELSAQRTELLRQLRAVARDEGDLPLIDLMDSFGPGDVPIVALMHELKGGQS